MPMTEKQKEWFKNNRDKVNATAKRFRDRNKKKIALKEKLYATKHREKRNALRLRNLRKTREARKLICKKSFDKNYLKDKSKHKTRKATKIALDHGKIIKQPCKYCGDVKSQVHHNDYKDPFNITWLCKKHHDAWHRVFEADI